ncbi:MAG TPA: transketolase [Bacteroidales bacterium]|nr:transketolase [Bacteroidales bacterium]HNS47452.1 transketolase [Bacteroidales bacterium]
MDNSHENQIALNAADNLRVLCAAMVEKARSGHPGGALGAADFIQILFAEYLRFDPSDPEWDLRDRFFLDPGHLSALLYAVLYLYGIYTEDDLKNFRQWGSPTPGHPELDIRHGIENTSGPLGLGHAMATGAALAERHLTNRFGNWMEHRIFTLISDGGIQEEISQGVGRIAGFLGLNNLIMFFDSNDAQLSTLTSAVTREDTARKYEAWGWQVLTIDGHDHREIRKALDAAVSEKQRPTLIIGKTIMAKGTLTAQGESLEGHYSTHGQPLSKAGASIENTIRNLGGDPQNPFAVCPEVDSYYARIRQEKIRSATIRKADETAWMQTHPAKAAAYQRFMSGKLPDLDFEAISLDPGKATRMASSNILEYLSVSLDNLLVMSADLANSDKTDGFLKNSKPLTHQDFTGTFLHAGVSELSMAAIANGIALHGGLYVACGTFLVFSDYMKPAVRLAALMGLPVIYIWTHDSFRVGEDGPTHQPVEQEAQIRLLEKLKNHDGENSILVLRPADGNETKVAWKMALENRKTPTALILSRQSIRDLPAPKGTSSYQAALGAQKGACTVCAFGEHPDVILLANGSEVATLYEVAKLLQEKGVSSRVVSAISEGLFRRQPIDYQKMILPDGVPVFGLTAGLPVTLQGLAGGKGQVMGMDHFGYSAPAEVLDEKFGFDPETIARKVQEFLSEK